MNDVLSEVSYLLREFLERNALIERKKKKRKKERKKEKKRKERDVSVDLQACFCHRDLLHGCG
jgi:hypothetical protein